MSGTGLWPSAVPTARTAFGPADLGGDPAVRPDLAARDLEGLVPDVALEVGVAAQVEVDPHPAVAGEPAVDGRGQASGSRSARMAGPAGPGEVGRLERGVVGAASTVDTPSPFQATTSGPIGESNRA